MTPNDITDLKEHLVWSANYDRHQRRAYKKRPKRACDFMIDYFDGSLDATRKMWNLLKSFN